MSDTPKFKWEAMFEFHADFSDELSMTVRQDNYANNAERYRWVIFHRPGGGHVHRRMDSGYCHTLTAAFLAAEDSAKAQAELLTKERAGAAPQTEAVPS